MEIHPIITVAPDSFKESLSAQEACRWITKGILAVYPRAQIRSIPMADGGEGTLEALSSSGRILQARVRGPLGKKVSAQWGVTDHGKTAVIEMAQASGLALVPHSKRNPMAATSFGAGELIKRALDRGCRKIILTLGGTATSDGGAGMAQALGFRFLDKEEREIPPGAEGLKFLSRIDSTNIHARIKRTQFLAACDVQNPLLGKFGSARIYSPQKGATPGMVRAIEKNLSRLALIVQRDLKINMSQIPGGGAAGGAGAGAAAFLGAKLEKGIELVLKEQHFEERIQGSDLILTGEGQIDGQTLLGKTLFGIGRIAKKNRIPAIAFCGQTGRGYQNVRRLGIRAIYCLRKPGISREDSLKRAGPLLRDAVAMALMQDPVFELI